MLLATIEQGNNGTFKPKILSQYVGKYAYCQQ